MCRQTVGRLAKIELEGSCDGFDDTHENGDNHRRLRGCDGRVAVGVGATGRESLEPVGHSKDTADCASVISEENTTESNEETNADGGPCCTGCPWGRPELNRHLDSSDSRT